MDARHFLMTALSLALAVALPASPGPAQQPPSHRPAATTPGMVFADCVVARDMKGSDRLVRSEPGTADESAAFASLASSLRGCSRRVAGTWPRPMLRGIIAERLWVTNIWQISGTGPASDPNRIDFDKGFDTAPELRDTYRLAFCVARIHSGLVDALVRTRPSSGEEQAAFEALKQPISSCLANGRSLALERPFLRALLAEQLYRSYPLPWLGPIVRRPGGAGPAVGGMLEIPGRGVNQDPVPRSGAH